MYRHGNVANAKKTGKGMLGKIKVISQHSTLMEIVIFSKMAHLEKKTFMKGDKGMHVKQT